MLTALAICESIYVLIIVSHIYSFIPIHWSVVIPKGLEPERENFFYLVFLFTAFAFMAAACVFIRPQLEQASKRLAWAQFLAVEFFWVCLLLFAYFKWLTYRYPFYPVLAYENGRWVLPFFYGLLTLSLLSKIFWMELRQFFNNFYPKWLAFNLSPRFNRLALAGAVVGIFLLLLPRVDEVVALSYWWDQFNHWDDFPLTRWLLLHGMDYSRLVFMMFIAGVVYWGLLFFMLEWWLQSFWLAAFGVLLGLKMNLFHYGISPLGWLFPQQAGIMPFSWQGMDNVPMYSALWGRQFFPFFMGFSIPVFYVFTFLLAGAVLINQRAFRQMIPVVLIAAYGLFSYTGYISQPTLFHYGAGIVPLVVLLCFWLKYIVTRFIPHLRKVVFAVLAFAALGALLTNRLFVTYPHAVPIYGQDFKQECLMFKKSFDLTQDIALIQNLTSPKESVAIIGSFELTLLNQAKRRALFSHCPLMSSALMDSNSIRGLRLKTKEELLAAFNELERSRPPYVFIERKLLMLPEEFYQGTTGLAGLLKFVRNHYDPQTQGHYFVALKIK